MTRAEEEFVISCPGDEPGEGKWFGLDSAALVELEPTSTTGLSFEGNTLYRCEWTLSDTGSAVVAYSEGRETVRFELEATRDLHDVRVVDDQIVVACTGTNELRWLDLDGAETRRWRLPGEGDSWHLNGVAKWNDRLVVTVFGPFLRSKEWQARGRPASGCVIEVDSGELLVDGLHAPHCPVEMGPWLLVCLAAAGELVAIDPSCAEIAKRVQLGGWARGLSVGAEYLWVGTSPNRGSSSSTRAELVVVDRASWCVEDRIALPARYVYAVERVAGWRRLLGS